MAEGSEQQGWDSKMGSAPLILQLVQPQWLYITSPSLAPQILGIQSKLVTLPLVYVGPLIPYKVL